MQTGEWLPPFFFDLIPAQLMAHEKLRGTNDARKYWYLRDVTWLAPKVEAIARQGNSGWPMVDGAPHRIPPWIQPYLCACIAPTNQEKTSLLRGGSAFTCALRADILPTE